MVLRCGVDLMETQRIADGLARFGDKFLHRFFTEAEIAYCGPRPERLAARFAAKEAVAKALGTGVGDVGWREIEVLADARGRPVLHLHGNAARLAAELGLTTWDISLTHTVAQACAVVVAMGEPR